MNHLNGGLLYHTLKHLRWEQIVYRPWRIAQYRFYRAFPRLAARWTDEQSPAPEVSSHAIATIKSVFENSFVHLNALSDWRDQQLIDLAASRFTFLNKTLTINRVDWNTRYENHLWNYQFHYFSFALWSAQALAERGDTGAWRHCRKLIESWIEQARVGRSDGWNAYPVSLRVVNWIYAYVVIAGDNQDQEFLGRWRASIYRQLDFLAGHLELHLLANHLLKNIKALIVGGLFFNNAEWLKAGERLLWREFDEQVLSDGGHYERAPMYHAQSLADFLECYALLRAFDQTPKSAQVESKLRAMASFLSAMSYPDDTLALFNDSANTEETRPSAIIESVGRIVGANKKITSLTFSETGYYCWKSTNDLEKIIVDAGPPAVSYNLAHAHCDLLSYELWLGGKPFIVDSGVHGYAGDRFREYCRSTRAHNTVMFDGREQSEVWGTFRMARRAEVVSAEVQADGKQDWKLQACYRLHDDSNSFHERTIWRTPAGEWVIEDRALGTIPARAMSFIHLHPDVRARKVGTEKLEVECELGELKILIEPSGADDVEIIAGSENPIQGWRFHDFGVAQPSATICFGYRVNGNSPFGYRIKTLARVPFGNY